MERSWRLSSSSIGVISVGCFILHLVNGESESSNLDWIEDPRLPVTTDQQITEVGMRITIFHDVSSFLHRLQNSVLRLRSLIQSSAPDRSLAPPHTGAPAQETAQLRAAQAGCAVE